MPASAPRGRAGGAPPPPRPLPDRSVVPPLRHDEFLHLPRELQRGPPPRPAGEEQGETRGPAHRGPRPAGDPGLPPPPVPPRLPRQRPRRPHLRVPHGDPGGPLPPLRPERGGDH